MKHKQIYRNSLSISITALLLLSMLLTAIPIQQASASPDVTVTPATSVEISADNVATGTYTTLDAIIIAEGSATDIGTTGNLILNIPDGFLFDDTSAPSVTVQTGSELTIGTVTITTTQITIPITVEGTAVSDTITIGGTTPIKVIPSAGTPLASGNIYADEASVDIPGITEGSDGTNFGTLTEVPGALHHFTFTPPDPPLATQGVEVSIDVEACDQYENTIDTYGGPATLTSSDTLAEIFDSTTSKYVAIGDGYLVSFTAGTATLKVKFYTFGDQTLTLTDDEISSESDPILVSTLHHFDIEVPEIVTKGTPFAITVTAKIEDGSTLPDYTGTVHFTSTDPEIEGLPEEYTFIPDDLGMHEFTGITLNTFGVHTITVSEDSIKSVSGPITVGVEVTEGIEVEVTGNVGDKVTVYGTDVTLGGLIKIYWDSVKEDNLLAQDYAVGISYEIEITIPEAKYGVHYIIAKDVEAGTSTYATFNIEPKIVLTPESGLPGDTVTVTGTGFAAKEEITLTADVSVAFDMPDTKPKTNGLGSFTAKIKVTTDADIDATYTITATDKSGHSAPTTFKVDYYITVEPKESPPGTTVQVSGRIAEGKDVTVIFGKEGFWLTAFLTMSDAETGEFSGEYVIPSTLEKETYTFKVKWDSESRDISFEVSTAPEITLDPTDEYPGGEVEVTGKDFCANANVTIYLDTLVVNGTVTTDADGKFVAIFTVPQVPAGTYKVKAVDQHGATAQALFTVNPPLAIVIETRSTAYMQGDSVSIYANCSESKTATLNVTDPAGAIFWTRESVDINKKVGNWYVLADLISFDLPSDAPTGTWNFTAYDTEGKILATNLFTVSPKAAIPGVEDLAARVAALEESMAALSETVESLSDKVDALSTAVAAINIQVLSETVNLVKSDVAGLKTDISDLKTDISSTISTAEDAVDAAAAAQTAAENAQAAAESASSAVSGVTMAIYGAIILSLLAAIASIITVVTLQRKLAG